MRFVIYKNYDSSLTKCPILNLKTYNYRPQIFRDLLFSCKVRLPSQRVFDKDQISDKSRDPKKVIYVRQNMFPPGLEPGTFRVLGERDNHYTTETWCGEIYQIIYSRFWLLVQKSSAFDAFQSPKELFRPDKRHRNLRKMF